MRFRCHVYFFAGFLNLTTSSFACLFEVASLCLLAFLISGQTRYKSLWGHVCSLPYFEDDRLCMSFRSHVYLFACIPNLRTSPLTCPIGVLFAHFLNLRTSTFACLFDVSYVYLLASIIWGQAPCMQLRGHVCSLPNFEDESRCVSFRSHIRLFARFLNLRMGAFACLFEVMSVCLLASLICEQAPLHALSGSRSLASLI